MLASGAYRLLGEAATHPPRKAASHEERRQDVMGWRVHHTAGRWRFFAASLTASMISG